MHIPTLTSKEWSKLIIKLPNQVTLEMVYKGEITQVMANVGESLPDNLYGLGSSLTTKVIHLGDEA